MNKKVSLIGIHLFPEAKIVVCPHITIRGIKDEEVNGEYNHEIIIICHVCSKEYPLILEV